VVTVSVSQDTESVKQDHDNGFLPSNYRLHDDALVLVRSPHPGAGSRPTLLMSNGSSVTFQIVSNPSFKLQGSINFASERNDGGFYVLLTLLNIK
jgi:hypothetical protein